MAFLLISVEAFSKETPMHQGHVIELENANGNSIGFAKD